MIVGEGLLENDDEMVLMMVGKETVGGKCVVLATVTEDEAEGNVKVGDDDCANIDVGLLLIVDATTNKNSAKNFSTVIVTRCAVFARRQYAHRDRVETKARCGAEQHNAGHAHGALSGRGGVDRLRHSDVRWCGGVACRREAQRGV